MDGRSLLTKLYRELRPTVRLGQNVYNCTHWKYIISVAKKNKEIKDPKLLKIGENYLNYLESTRKYGEIMIKYKGKGELSVDELARLMGFRMPNEPKESRNQKNENV